MIQKILVAFDSSPHSQRAVDFAATLALRYPCRIFLLHVLTLGHWHLSGLDQFEIFKESESKATTLLSQIATHLKELGVQETETTLLYGPPVSVILGFAEMHQPDLIILGARGTGTWPGHTIGSVSMAIAHRAECPVLIMR